MCDPTLNCICDNTIKTDTIGFIFIATIITGVILGVIVGKYNGHSFKQSIEPFLIGFIERLFFIIGVAYEVSGIAIACIGWITIKMYANHINAKNEEYDKDKALRALKVGLVSVIVGVVLGLILNGSIPIQENLKFFA